MFIPLAEVPSKIMGGGEERHYFLFHERDSDLPVEIVITRLPPLYEANRNWHKHDFVEEFSIPLTGEIVISEKRHGKVENRSHSEALLRDAEWVTGISCQSAKGAFLHIDSPSGSRRDIKIIFDSKYTEGKDWHRVENPTSEMVTMVTMKRVPRKILKKDPLIFKVDRTPALEER